MCRMFDLTYSPDLSRSDFFFFLPVKQQLERIQVVDEDELFESLKAILRCIDQEKLNSVFQAWIQGVE
jgi:hypothetical protein